MRLWERVLLVKVKKTRLQPIELVEDVETIHFIDARDFVLIVALEDLLNSANQVGEIDIDHLIGKNHSIVSFNFFCFIVISIFKNCKFYIKFSIYAII